MKGRFLPSALPRRSRASRTQMRASARRPHLRRSVSGRARCWCSPAGPTPGSLPSSMRCWAPTGRSSPRCPGTTRDAVEAHTDFLGWPVRLADTAGLWDAPNRIDRLGVEVSQRYVSSADLVLLCVEAGRPLGEDEAAIARERPVLLVRTKADLATEPGEGLAVSVLSGEGLGVLRRSAAERMFFERMALADLEPGLTRERHRLALAPGAGCSVRGDTPFRPWRRCRARRAPRSRSRQRAGRAARGDGYRGGAGPGVWELLRG